MVKLKMMENKYTELISIFYNRFNLKKLRIEDFNLP
jgi:hypothetical protein